MKLIIEDSDGLSLPPGCYDFSIEKIKVTRQRATYIGVGGQVVTAPQIGVVGRAILVPTPPPPPPPPPPPKSLCDECGNTGVWENPISGIKSPCSKGCGVA